MNFYNIVGQVATHTSMFLKKLGFKHIKSFNLDIDRVSIYLKKDKGVAQIRYIDPNERGFFWSVYDFEERAKTLAEDNLEGKTWEEIYDKTKFRKALHSMTHDANYGINWDSIDEALIKCVI